MPLARISLKQEATPAHRRAVADAVQEALVTALGVPREDRFQIITSHADDLIYDDGFLGITRTDGIVIVQIYLSTGRPLAMKKALYGAVADALAARAGVRPQDVFINLVETGPENWSFGNGLAQYADAPPPHLAKLAGA